MLKFLNKKKQDNKGFSLVELIIVVAIMAILVGLLAPQYIKYVEKSRKSSDATNLSEMVNAVQIYAADADSDIPAGTYTIEISDEKTDVTSDDADPQDVKDAIAETAPAYANTKLKSTKWDPDNEGASIFADITIKEDGGTEITYRPALVNKFITNAKSE